ncbi:nitrate reductase cytochrome c-type subunit [Aliarcobacter vitoriensis]|uniref:nitrate reductase cytochrome c-type subunit n=1 Tax=Aliarcobacter vitoriensis TaxID=2011099 RepID=UPI000DE9D22A|nr:nitrate reductase [Arcobacter sp. FW59]
MNLSKLTLSILTFSSILVVSMNAANSIKDDSLGLRHESLLKEDKVTGDETKYGTDPAGTSTKFKRAFENAPPMIPHDTEGLLPITIDNNMCTSCHDPLVAESMGATPIPKSHFTNFREYVALNKDGQLERDGKVVGNSSDLKTIKKPLDMLANARFNCSACHAPQSNSANIPKNNFTPDFRSSDLNDKSNLLDVITEGVK